MVSYMGGYQNYGLFLGALNISRCRTILGIQKGTIVFTSTHMEKSMEHEVTWNAFQRLHGQAVAGVEAEIKKAYKP